MVIAYIYSSLWKVAFEHIGLSAYLIHINKSTYLYPNYKLNEVMIEKISKICYNFQLNSKKDLAVNLFVVCFWFYKPRLKSRDWILAK